MPLIQTRGAASAQGFGEFAQAAVAANYIEDVFSCFLYTGTGANQTITNNIDLSTKGGLVWIKDRSNAESHSLWDTARGVSAGLQSNATSAQYSDAISLTAYNSNGFSLGTDVNVGWVNRSPDNYVSWTFREQAKFFDVVTYTGNSTAGRTIAHNLGSAPGCMIVKRTDTADGWMVYHRSTNLLILNSTSSEFGVPATATRFGDDTNVIAPTSSVFTLGTNGSVNATGGTYIAYLFAHDAGGFGLTGTDNVISCGSFSTGAGGGATVTLGYEPQWLMIKSSSNASSWYMFDTMRSWVVGGASAALQAQATNAEFNFGSSSLPANPTATGFTFTNGLFAASETWIYVAIRRGPMKVPTSGTSVFNPNARTGNGSTQTVSGLSFSPDLWMTKNRGNTQSNWFFDRLRGPNQPLSPNLTDNEATNTSNYFGGTPIFTPTNTGFTTIGQGQVNTTSGSYIDWLFGRAPSVFDEVCYTGTGVATTVAHNLAAVPELIIIKNRSSTNSGVVYTSSGGTGFYLRLFDSSGDSGNTATSGALWNNTSPTSSVFSIGTGNQVNGSTLTYVAYLFATCAGVSKVGSYTGTGATQTINCGFTGGARFVLIKKSTSTAPDRDWFVWDTARGMISGTDPSLKLNIAAAEVNANDVYTISTGFQLVSSADYVNASGVTYIFLAIA